LNNRTIVVLGAAGTIGQVIAWDWLRGSKNHHIIVADRDEARVKALARRLGPRAKAVTVNVLKPAQLKAAVSKGELVINSTSHHFNLYVMRAALHAGVHYIDLGGLFHFTRKQLKWHQRFSNAGLIGLLGMGCAPGITNLLARTVTEGWEKVYSIEVMDGSVDPDADPTALPYSWRTLYEEFTMKPAVYKRDGWHFVKPLSGTVTARFAPPIGKQKVFYTLHSEVATLPLIFRNRGVRHVSFRIGLSEELRQYVLKKKEPPPPPAIQLKTKVKKRPDHESAMVVVSGVKNGKPIRRIMQFLAQGQHGWRAGDLNTACPASIAAQLILNGDIYPPGVWAPEEVVPWTKIRTALERRGFKFVISK
jgi:saccharopine dehydrogenase-like NADP-dependent oxidoreductase